MRFSVSFALKLQCSALGRQRLGLHVGPFLDEQSIRPNITNARVLLVDSGRGTQPLYLVWLDNLTYHPAVCLCAVTASMQVAVHICRRWIIDQEYVSKGKRCLWIIEGGAAYWGVSGGCKS